MDVESAVSDSGYERHTCEEAEGGGLQMDLRECGVGGTFHLLESQRRLSNATAVWKLRRRPPGPPTPPCALCPGSPALLQQCTFGSGCDLQSHLLQTAGFQT